MNGGGFPMRFADIDGTPIDVYQAEHEHAPTSSQAYPATTDALLDNALGAARLLRRVRHQHAHRQPRRPTRREAIVASAQARGVPVISYKQLLEWIDGRNDSTIRGLELERRNLDLHHHRRPRRERAPDLAPDPGPDRDPQRAHAAPARPAPYTVQTSRASSTPCSTRHRHLPGDLLLSQIGRRKYA